jgi:hypothetical protein
MNRVLRSSVVLAAAVGAFASCKGDPTEDLRQGVDHLVANPTVLFIDEGLSQNVIVEARDAQGNQVGTQFTLGNVGTGISVVRDTTFNPVYAGEKLTAPGTVTRARFTVTALQQVSTSFQVRAGGRTIDISVATIPATAAAVFAPANPNIGDTITITAPGSLKFTPASTVTFAAGACAVVPGSLAADSTSLRCIPFPGSTGTATLGNMVTTYSTPGPLSVTAASGIVTPPLPALVLSPAAPVAGDTVTVTLSGLFRFTPGTGTNASACVAGPLARTFRVSISADSLTIRCLIGPLASGKFQVTNVQLSGRTIVGRFPMSTAADVVTDTLPEFAASKGTAAIADNITISAVGRYRFIPSGASATKLQLPPGATSSTPTITSDSLTMSFLIGPNWPGVKATLDSVVISGAAGLGRYSVHTDSAFTTPALTQFPATLSNRTPQPGEVVTLTAGSGFQFNPNATVTTGGRPAGVVSVTATTIDFVPIPRTGKAKPVVSGVVLTSNPALPLVLNAGVYLTAPGGYPGTDDFATAPNITMPATGQVAYIADGGAFFDDPGGVCLGNLGGPCRIFQFTIASTRSFNINATWQGTTDLGIYFFDSGLNLLPIFGCDAKGAGASGQPETCNLNNLPAGTYYIVVDTFSAFYAPPNNVDPLNYLIKITGL